MAARISDLFYLVAFLSIIGGIGCALLVGLQKATRFRIPFAIHLLLGMFFIVPLVMPNTELLYREPARLPMFNTVAIVWLIGFAISGALMVGRTLIANHRLARLPTCESPQINSVYAEWLRTLGLRRTPRLLSGRDGEPAFVVTTWRSYVVVRDDIVIDLTDAELRTVLLHELSHIKRKHTVTRTVFDFICCLHWFNPLVWITRNELSAACEIDCDRYVLGKLDKQVGAIGYAKVMLRLMELSTSRRKLLQPTLGALGYWETKQRITDLIDAPSMLKQVLTVFACLAIVAGMIWISLNISSSYFYPFGANNAITEWSVIK